MKRITLFIVISIMTALCHAQLNCQFVVREGYTYMAVTNTLNYTTFFNWKVYNPYNGEYTSGNMQSIKAKETLLFGPYTLQWEWQNGEHFEITHNFKKSDYVYQAPSAPSSYSNKYGTFSSGSNSDSSYSGSYNSSGYNSSHSDISNSTGSSSSSSKRESSCHRCFGTGQCTATIGGSADNNSHCSGSGKCGWCNGKGWDYYNGKQKTCAVCNGTKKCHTCSGTGKCQFCGGKGYR